jgi:hypothetical protein
MTSMADAGAVERAGRDGGAARAAGERAARSFAARRAGERGFPGPWVSGICLVAAGPLAVVSSALAIGLYSESGSTLAASLADHHPRMEWALNLDLASVMLSLFVVVFLAQAIAASHPRLGRAGGVLALLGLLGPGFFLGIFWGASHIVDTPAHEKVAALLIDGSNRVPTTIDNISGALLLAGFIVLGVGAARSGLLGRGRAAALAVTCLIPFGFISGYMVISCAAYVGLVIAAVPLGVQVLRDARVATAAVATS